MTAAREFGGSYFPNGLEMIVAFLAINFLISVFNAWATGRSWAESRAAGGTARLMSWAGATMSAVGFSWCYLVVAAFLAGPEGFNKLPAPYVQAMFDLGWLALLVPLFGSSIAITLSSWAHFWRRRTFGSGAIAAWNTGADVYNVYQVVEHAPSAWSRVSSTLFDSDDDDDAGYAKMAIVLAIAALFAGVLTAALIIGAVAKRTANDRRFEILAR